VWKFYQETKGNVNSNVHKLNRSLFIRRNLVVRYRGLAYNDCGNLEGVPTEYVICASFELVLGCCCQHRLITGSMVAFIFTGYMNGV